MNVRGRIAAVPAAALLGNVALISASQEPDGKARLRDVEEVIARAAV